MLQKLTHFIKYHNALPIAVSLVVAGSGAALAATNDAVREQIVSEEVVVQSVDNNYILSTDLAAFNPGLQITTVEEDDDFYYVAYTYNTIAIDDYLWRDKVVEETLAVSKEALGERDLGAYVAEELGQTVEAKMAYLKDVQKIEKKRGVSKKVATVTYSGLVGKFLEPKEETFEGYTPVKEEQRPYVASVEEAKQGAAIAATNAVSNQIAAAIPSKEEVERIIEKKVAELLAAETLTTSTSSANTTTSTTSGSAGSSTTSSGGSTDTTPPTLTITGNNPAEIEVGTNYADLGATVTDDVNDNLGIHYAVDGVEVTTISLDTSTDRTYTITYSATDQAGNTGSAERTVIIGTGEYVAPDTTTASSTNTASTTPATTEETIPTDTTDPTITLTGAATMTLTQGDTFTDPGTTAADETDGDLTASITTSGTVDTTTAGTYTITYRVSDAAGNSAEVTRTVTVEAASPEQPADTSTGSATTTDTGAPTASTTPAQQ